MNDDGDGKSGEVEKAGLLKLGYMRCTMGHISMLCVGFSLLGGVGAVEQVRYACSASSASTSGFYMG